MLTPNLDRYVSFFGDEQFPLRDSLRRCDYHFQLWLQGCPGFIRASCPHPGLLRKLWLAIVFHSCEEYELLSTADIFTHVAMAASMGTGLVKHPLAKAVGFTGFQLAGRKNTFQYSR